MRFPTVSFFLDIEMASSSNCCFLLRYLYNSKKKYFFLHPQRGKFQIRFLDLKIRFVGQMLRNRISRFSFSSSYFFRLPYHTLLPPSNTSFPLLSSRIRNNPRLRESTIVRFHSHPLSLFPYPSTPLPLSIRQPTSFCYTRSPQPSLIQSSFSPAEKLCRSHPLNQLCALHKSPSSHYSALSLPPLFDPPAGGERGEGSFQRRILLLGRKWKRKQASRVISVIFEGPPSKRRAKESRRGGNFHCNEDFFFLLNRFARWKKMKLKKKGNGSSNIISYISVQEILNEMRMKRIV